jgi:hypothetical protein
MLGFDIGFSGSASSGASIGSPKSFNLGSGRTSPVVWLVIGAVALLGLVIWLKKHK